MTERWKLPWREKASSRGWFLVILVINSALLPLTQSSDTPFSAEDFKFTQETYNVSISENYIAKTYTVPESSRMGIPVTTSSLDIKYRIIYGNDQGFFKSDAKTVGDFCFLQIRTRTNTNDVLNRESQDKFYLTVKAIGRSFSSGSSEPFEARTQVIVKVLDLNDLMPLFHPTHYSTEIGEDKQLHSSILQVTASDADEGVNGEIYYSFHRKTNHFAIHPTSGVITLTRPLVYSEQNYYELDVLARDRGAKVFSSGISSMSMAKVRVKVVQVNQHAPDISVKRMPVIPDNVKPGTVCAVVTVKDEDPGQNGELDKVHIMHGDPGGQFNLIQMRNDQFSLQVARPLEREVIPIYNITIQAIDKGMPPQTSTVSLFVNLKEAHMNVPRFEGVYNVSIEEISPPNTPVLFVKAVSQRAKSGDMFYKIIAGNEQKYFKINSYTGLISSAAVLDYETRKRITLQVMAEDRSNLATPLNAATSVSIMIADYNDNTPVFNMTSTEIEVQENQTIGSLVCQVSAYDLDEGDNGRLTYRITNLNPVPFEINHFSGKITTTTVLDFEEQRRIYHLTVRASDRGKPFRRESETKLTIRLKDTNDHKPLFEKVNCQGYLSREAPVGTELFVVSAIDFDSGNIISYQFVSGNEDECFSLSSATGVLKLNCDLKNKDSDTRSLRVTATDGVHLADPIFVNITLVNNNRNHQLSNNDVSITCEDTKVTRELSEMLQRAETANQEIDREGEHVDLTDRKNLNRHIPQFAENIVNRVNILENVPVGSSIMRLHAYDDDLGYNGELVYVISSGNPDSCFTIDLYTGVLRVLSPLDREMETKYILNVTVSDLGQPPLSAHKLVSVNVEDVNDCAPEFTMMEYEAIIPENSGIDTTVVQVSAEDQDIGINSEITYRSLTDNDHFKIDSESGIITVSGPVDRESQDIYSLYVEAVDGAVSNPLTSTAKVTVTLTDINDNAPSFVPENYFLKVREDIPVGAVVAIISARDPDSGDGGTITYKLLRGTWDKFEVDRQTGVIRVIGRLDYERQQLYNITGMARDRGKPSMSSTCQIIVEIIDVDENMYAPLFRYQVTQGSVKENMPVGSSVMQVTARDDDHATLDSKIVYSIRGGSGMGVFSIDSKGTIKTNEVLDRETTQFYWLTVYAQDRAAVPKSSSVEVYVEVEDVNDNNPQAVQPVYYPSVFENSEPGTTVAQVQAYDMDHNTNQRLTYQITGGNPQSFFAINTNTGILTTTRRKLDRERQEEHILEVTISDNGDPVLTSTTRVVVKIGDVNDNAPKFTERVYRVQVPEVSQDDFDTPLCRVMAFDQDVGPNADIEYMVRSGKGKFRINSRTGVLYAQKTLTKGQEFEVTVRANDNGRPQKRSSTLVIIKVVERPTLSENPPRFREDGQRVSVMENEAIGKLLCILEGVDDDPKDKLWYNIIAGDDDEQFAIDMNKGSILIAKALDWESKTSYNLTVSVTDGVHTTYSWVHVTVLDINDNRPEFLQDLYKAEIAENSPIGSSVLAVTAMDRDENRRLFYTIHTATNTASLHVFTIDSDTASPTAGLIRIKEPLDREAIHRHELVIMARDQGTPSKRNFVRVVILVDDHNDHAPKFLAEEYQGSVFETAAIGTSVVQIQAMDRDKGKNAEITYSILSGNVGGMFSIDPTLGTISLAKSLDRDQQDLYILKVKAMDGGDPALTSTAKVRVKVTVSNNAPPKFDQEEYGTEIEENLPVDTHVLVVSADSRSSVVYEILDGECQDKFVINPNSGVISTKVVFDYEQITYCNLTVVAMNMVGMKTNATVLVHIIDVNDNHPEFLQSEYVGNISEAASPGTVILDMHGAPLVVGAHDNDTNLNAFLLYEIMETDTQGMFEMVSNTGALHSKVTLDREDTEQHIFTVQVKDKGKPSLSATTPAKVIINVLDVNDSPPEFTKDVYTAKLRLPTYHGVVVVTVEAEDADSEPNAQVSYEIISGDPYNLFKIDSKTGVIVVQQENNITSNVSLHIRASDGKFEVNASVFVEVLRSRETRLKFTEDVYTASIPENSNNTHNIAVVQTLGPALNAHFKYRIINPSAFFQIGETSGVVQTLGVPCDREVKDLYKVIVEVSDSSPVPQVAHTVVEVKIDDVNDNAPMFVNQPYYAVVSVEAERGDLVKQVTAIDRDLGANGEVRYKLIYQNVTSGKFAIDAETGAIVIEESLSADDESAGYVLLVEAADQGTPSLKTQVMVPLRVLSKATPVFDQAFYTASIPENSPIQSAVINIEAKSPYQRKLIYSISKGDKYNEFAVDFDTDMDTLGPCAITVAEKLDNETNSRYELTLRATDTFTGIFAEVPVTVQLEDVNDNAPSFSSQYYTKTVSEATPIGASIIKVSAEDADSGVNSRIHYEILDSPGSTDNLLFTIDENDGTISTRGPLDHETRPKLYFIVVASDGGIPSLNATVKVTIIVTDLNDNAPAFDNPSYECIITDQATRGQFVTMVTATDADSTDDGNLVYSIVDGNDKQTFVIEGNSGIISLSTLRKPDLDPVYTLNISVSDGVFTSFTRVRVVVQNSNHFVPQFTERIYSIDVAEDTVVGQKIAIVTALDRDRGNFGRVAYSINSDESRDLFNIDPTSGEMSIRRMLDREVKDVYEVPVVGVDQGGRTGFATVKVTVKDINDNKPDFVMDHYTYNVYATAEVDALVIQVKAFDADFGENASLEYSIFSGGSNSSLLPTKLFKIEEYSGKIRVKDNLTEFENELIRFFIKVVDKGRPSLENVVSVEVFIMSADHQPPRFKRSSYSYFLPEDTAVGTDINAITAESTGTVKYSIVDGNEGTTNKPPKFTIKQDGKIFLIEPLDHEDVKLYTLTIEAKTDTNPPLVDYTEVIINVMDNNDNNPVFETNPYSVSIAENSELGSQVIQIKATDKDSPPNADITYSFSHASAEIANVFRIDAQSGWIATLVPLDRETVPSYSFTVIATDNGSPTKLSDEAEVRIEIADHNDEPPIFSQEEYTGAVNEDALPGTVIVVISTTDQDLGQNALVSYHITAGDRLGQFNVRQTGEVFVNKILDRERKAKYELKVEASDGAFVTNAKVIIHILDANDNDPHCDKPMYQSIIPEDVVINTYIAQVSATDDDERGTRNARINYHLEGDGADRFLMDPKTGILTTREPLDREVIPEYHLIVRAIDGGGRSCTTEMYITLSDVNDNAPWFSTKKYSVAISENAEVNTLLTRVSATDMDLGINRKIQYSLSGPYSDHFHIDYQSGIVSVAKQLDREKRASYNLTISATDMGTPAKTNSSILNIVLLDVNDNPPEFERGIYYSGVREDMAVGSMVTKVFAVSKDIGINAKISYAIVGGNEQNVFRIDSKSGIFYLAKNLDYEKVREYFLTVRASDGGSPSLSSTTKVNINVTDYNDCPPVFSKLYHAAKVREDAKPGPINIKIQAIDADSEPNSQITYTIVRGNDEGIFSINQSSENFIWLKGTLDRETVDSYTLSIIAKDSGQPQLSGSAQVTIEVLDANDNPPEFEQDNFTAIVQEGAALGHHVTKFVLVDKDLDPNGPPFSLSIISGNDDHDFRVSRDGVLSTIATFEKDIKEEYNLVVRAFDNGIPPRYSDVKVLIKIIDESMYAPEFLPLSLTVSSYMDLFPGGIIGQLRAVDKDLYDALEFRLADEHMNMFEVDPVDGVILANDGIDGGMYNINVSVSDGKFTSYGVVEIFVQTITDEMVENAVIIRLSNVSPLDFIANLKYKFINTLAQELAIQTNDIIILGVQPAPTSTTHRRKRQVSEDLDILMAVHKSDDSFYKKNPLKRRLMQALPTLEKALDIPVSKVFSDVCTDDLCENGKCVSVVQFDGEHLVRIKTEDGATFASPKHLVTHKCECKDHYGGQRCEIALNDCAAEPCPRYKICEPDELHGYQCLCPSGKTGPRCEEDAFKCIGRDCRKPETPAAPKALSFRGDSYVLWNILGPIERRLALSMYVRTLQKNAILIFAGKLDRFILEMIDGLIQYRFDLGSGEGIAQVNYYINDGRWHQISIIRNRNSAELSVDGKYTAQAIAPGYSASMNIENNAIYFGGQVTALNYGYSDVSKGFEGCMKDILINGASPPVGGTNRIAILQKLEKVKLQCDADMIGPCNSAPCRHGGTCENRGLDYICHCSSRYVGQRCEIDLNPCASQPCMHKGDCENLNNDYICHCKGQFSGKTCDYGYFCNPNPCRNHGECIEGRLGPICHCKGFTGKFCQLDIDECIDNPCRNGGTCKNMPGSFNCSCTPEAKGLRCEDLNLPQITSSGINISMDELYGIIGVCVGILLIVIIIVAVCRWKRRRYNRHRVLAGEGQRSNDMILNCTSEFKAGKMSNLDVASSKNNPNIPPSPKPPPIPMRPASYTPSGQDSMHALNNFDTIRNYGSAADDLESVHNGPIYTPEFLHNLNLNQNLQKSAQRPVLHSNTGSDTDSICKPQWELDFPNIVENLDNLKNPKETQSKQINKPQPDGHSSVSSLPISENDDDLPGKKKGSVSLSSYHWDTSDWDPKPALHNITEVPSREVHDSHSGSNTTCSSNSHATVHEVKMADPGAEDYIENDSEYVGDSEFADNSDNDVDYDGSLLRSTNYEQYLGPQEGLNYEDLKKHDYNTHLNNYLPTYSISNVSMSDAFDGQSEISENVQFTDDDVDHDTRDFDGNLSEFTDLENDDDVQQHLLRRNNAGQGGRASPDASVISDISGLCDIEDSEVPSDEESHVGTRLIGSKLHTQV